MTMRISKRDKWSKTLRSAEEGSALVELALSVPLLLLMLLGAAEFARVAYAAIEVTNAAHSAVMYAASGSSASSDRPGIGNAAAADSPNLVGTNAVSVTSVSSTCTCSDGKTTPSSCTDNSTCQNAQSTMITTVTVQTQATYSPLIHVPSSPLTFTLHGQSSQVVSNQ